MGALCVVEHMHRPGDRARHGLEEEGRCGTWAL